MNTRRVAVSLYAVIVLICMMALPYQADAQFGRVTGKVTDAGTGSGLPGANVLLTGTTLGDATDLKGEFLITRVPVGAYTINVDYLGFATQTAEITISANQAVTQDFSLSEQAIAGEEVVVFGIRAKTQARALNQQKNAANIMNIVASDQIGRFPDSNAPEALQRIPGISIARDMGEGRYVQIRGGSPAMTSLNFNGERIPSPEGDVRQIALDAVPVDILESIEVSKAITPDMDADAIGGSVNLVTKRAPEKGMLSIDGSPGYAPLRENAAGKGSVVWGNRFADGKAGLLLSGSVGKRFFGSDDLEPEYDFGDDAGLADDRLDEMHVRHYTLSRLRTGATAVLDYRPNENSEFYLDGTFTELQDDELRRRLRHRPGKGDYNAAGDTAFDGRIVYQHKDRLEKLSSWNFTAGGEHLLKGDMELDYHLTLAQSGENTPKDTEIEFVQKKVDFYPDISDPDNIQANPEAGALAGPFKFDNIEPAHSITTNKDLVAAVNFSLPYRLGAHSVGKLKLGGKFRQKDKNQNVYETVWELGSEADDIIMGEGNGEAFDNSGYNPGKYPYPPRVIKEEEVRNFVDDHRSDLEFEYDHESDEEDFDAQETTIALYGMTEVALSPELMILAGVRFEQTQLDNTGYSFDADADYPDPGVDKAPSGGSALDPIKGSSSYNRIFPMVHVRYRLTPATNIRAAVTGGLLRPNFFDLAPYKHKEDEDIAMGNPELEPATSTNLDLLFEHYLRPLGVLSAGLFYKAIRDPIFHYTTDNALGGKTTQPGNGKDAWIRGFEVAFQQQLRFLPAPLDGVGIYVNYTFTDSESTHPDGRKSHMPGQAENVYNAAVSYEKGPFSGQLSFNYNDSYVDEFGGDIGSGLAMIQADVFVNTHFQIDFSATYRVTPAISVYLELVNLNNEPWRLYQTDEARPIQAEFYEQTGWAGIKFNM